MELIVGTNCYFEVNEANEIIKSRLSSKDPVRVLWESLSDEDKQIIIINSTERYDNNGMLYKGTKVMPSQPLQFPRLTTYKVYAECPEKIKVGILLQGIRDAEDLNSEIEQMRELGIHSFSDGGGASITFESGNNRSGSKLKNKLGISRDLWVTYFAEYSFLI